jgi:hypothetical protein
VTDDKDVRRSTDKIVGDLLDAAEAASEIVGRGKAAWEADRLIRLAGEAVINRLGDAATKLPEDLLRWRALQQ